MDRLKRRALRRHQAQAGHRYHGPDKPPKNYLLYFGNGRPSTLAEDRLRRKSRRWDRQQRPARKRKMVNTFIPW